MSTTAPPLDQNRLIDYLLEKCGLKNDAALSRHLEVAPPVISKIRHHRLPVGASLTIRIMENCGVSLQEIKALLAAPTA
jgi:plasmid maintenance system antidote protein VapI